MKEQSLEGFIFEFIDQCKFLFFPEQWNNTFMDYSKNEVFALFFVYRKQHANMTEIADYIGVPLNTATGIVSRLEKRGVIKRERDIVDKRVVTIGISDSGKEFLIQQLKELEHYYHLLMETITVEERNVLMSVVGKFFERLNQDHQKNEQILEKKKNIKKIIIE